MSEDEEEARILRKRVIDYCRRNAYEELQGLLNKVTPNPSQEPSEEYTPEEVAVAELINSAQEPLGDYALHIAALFGSAEVVEILTGQQGVEIEPRARDGSYPLHRLVQCAINNLGTPDQGEKIRNSIRNVEWFRQAGHNTQVRDYAKRKPIDLIGEWDERLLGLRLALIEAAGPPPSMKDSDVVDEDKPSNGGYDSASDDEWRAR